TIYGVGRYTDGLPNDKMRFALTKINPADGTPVWVRLGHIPQSEAARLYGADLVLDGTSIYTVCHGDPVGNSATKTQIFLQKTSTDGDLIWIKQYDLPGDNDHAFEILNSNGGIVVMADQRDGSGRIFLFKIDLKGNMLWAKEYIFPDFSRIDSRVNGTSQLIKYGHNYIFTGFGVNASGNEDIFVVRTDLDGNAETTCVESHDVTIPVHSVIEPVFYPASLEIFDVQPNVSSPPLHAVSTPIKPQCIVRDSIKTLIQAAICEGESYEGYTVTGIYVDVFTTSSGCDSVRTLELTVRPKAHSSIAKQICEGESFEGYSSTGTYEDTFEGANGCDSIRTLTLEVLPAIITVIKAEICLGGNYEGYTHSGIY
ncbi:MAG TPA: hypothetical protein VJ508_03165, partial [Saprospiraceae bacterium]|nr:hypothetical protein [Saprospiraceae bacterium]